MTDEILMLHASARGSAYRTTGPSRHGELTRCRSISPTLLFQADEVLR